MIVEKRAELALAPSLDESYLARLIHAADGQFGTSVEFIQDAIQEALINGHTSVGPEHFARVYAARSGCSPDRNVFTEDNWHLINVSMALQDAHADVREITISNPEQKPRDKKNK